MAAPRAAASWVKFDRTCGALENDTIAVHSFGPRPAMNWWAAALAWSRAPRVFIEPDVSITSTVPTGRAVWRNGVTVRLPSGTATPFSRRWNEPRSGAGPDRRTSTLTVGKPVVSTLRMVLPDVASSAPAAEATPARHRASPPAAASARRA